MDPIFKDLFEYNNLVNQKLISEFVKQGTGLPENALKLMNHIVNAHHIWNSRIVGAEANAGVWYMHDVSDLARIDNFNYEDSLAILKERKLDETVEYMNSKGAVFTNHLRDILFHVINHSTYHRAQIATLLRDSGLEPMSTDYIFYKRESGVLK